MHKIEFGRMQRLPVNQIKNTLERRQFFTLLDDSRAAPTIVLITDYRTADVLKMNSDLMRPAGDERDLQESSNTKALPHIEFGGRGF